MRYALGLLTLLATNALAVPISSELFVTPSAQISNSRGSVFDSRDFGVSQAETLNDLAGSETAFADLGDTASVSADVLATWVDASQGTVRFIESWRTTEGDGDGLVGGFVGTGTRFRYTFIADATGLLNIAYDVMTILGDNRGAPRYSIVFRDLFQSRVVAAGPNESGLASFDVTAGNTYYFDISGSSAGGNIGVRDMSRQATFNWSVPVFSTEPPTTIPEPGSFSLLGGGLIAFALATRRRAARWQRS